MRTLPKGLAVAIARCIVQTDQSASIYLHAVTKQNGLSHTIPRA